MLKVQLTDLVEDKDEKELERQKRRSQENVAESNQGCEVQTLNEVWG